MPIYEFQCKKCGHEFEVWQKISDKKPGSCPKCRGRKITKLISQSSFMLKGSGWYATDYGNRASFNKQDNKENSDTKSEGADTKPKSKSDKKSDSKTATKKETKSKTKNNRKTKS